MNLTNITAEVPFLWKPPTFRPEGVHLSDILKLMREDVLNEVYPDDEDLEPDELLQAKLMREEGFMFESLCSIAYADQIKPRPESQLFDGVWMSPDGAGVEQESGRNRVDEIKWTQSYKAPDQRREWLWQHMAYCLMCNATIGRFYVCHTNGTSRQERGPVCRVYAVEYSEQELVQNWESIKNYAKAKGML